MIGSSFMQVWIDPFAHRCCCDLKEFISTGTSDAFAVLTFAFLGAPRTTRQSRNFSIGSSIIAVFGLRMAGFACSVMAVKSSGPVLVQYAMVFSAIGVGLWMIISGVVVEPPPGLMEAINRSNARIARLFGRPATA